MLRRQHFPPDSMSFLAGDSEMARRIREFDWVNHPFGPVESWPQSLKSALGICLNSAFPTAIYWGSELRLLYNDAWAPIPGPRHPAALGSPAQQVWSDIWHVIEPQFTHLIATGEGIFVEDQMLPMQRYGVPEETYWSYSFTPIRGADGAIEGVFNSGSETTRNVLLQRQMQFLLDLGEAFRTSADLPSARRIAVEMLGRHIGATRVGIREIAADGDDEFVITEEWTGAGIEPVGKSVGVSDFGPWIGETLHSGRILRVDDIDTEDRLGEARTLLKSMGVAAIVAVPWMEGGRLVAIIFVHSKNRRGWNDFQVTTAEKVLERTMLWMERERAAERERIMMREIDHRARNALAVAQSVVRLTLAEDIDTFREKIEDRITSLARAHTLFSSKRWEPIGFRTLLEQELAPYGASGSASVFMSGPPILLRPEQAQTLALLLHELTTNAAKYGALRTPGGSLDVTWDLGADDLLEIDWRERAAPGEETQQDHQRGGFGSTLLNRIVEQQPGGRIERRFEKSGLHCVLAVPLFPPVSKPGARADRENAGAGSKLAEQVAEDEAARGSVLVVEDEPIVAMDVASLLSDLGYSVFATVSSVAEGLEILSADTPDCAVVDVNLAGQTSEELARVLAERGVPFALMTGYTETGDLPEPLNEAPCLAKPVSAADLAKAIDRLIAR